MTAISSSSVDNDVDLDNLPRYGWVVSLLIAIALISQAAVCLYVSSTDWKLIDKAAWVIVIMAIQVMAILASAVIWAHKGYRLKTVGWIVLWVGGIFAFVAFVAS